MSNVSATGDESNSGSETSPIAKIFVGTAGWAMPGEGDSHLVRYARKLNACEINSTFRSRHRPATYQRWADSVPADFRFSLKMPEEVTHKARLIDCKARVDEFLQEISALGAKSSVILVQTPPSLECDSAVARIFFEHLKQETACNVAFEPRHLTWFSAEADQMLSELEVARVAADPATVPAAAKPGGWAGLRYYRWHGSPKVYYSSYEDERLQELATELPSHQSPTWCIFDNTTLGAGTDNALKLSTLLAHHPSSP